MPSYKVKAPGFFNAKFYDPNGKRPVLHTDKPFTKKNPMPSWVSDMPKESAAVKAKREAQAASQDAADKQKAEQDQKDVEDLSFLGAGETAVETL